MIGRELVLLNHAGGAEFKVAKSMLPSLPGALINDVAVGDLNNDGLPDLVLALGLASFDRADLLGLPDLVLMNLGHGRFERHHLNPTRESFTRGVTLADMDGDGRLDIVESVDTSALSGPGRILLNRTEPGGLVPLFEVSEHVWDRGPFGMGAAVADLNGDGHLDIYAASIGGDQLTYGTSEGAFEPQAMARGVHHRWGPEALRVHWGPSLIDLNADGLLDILVRHGGKFEIESAGLTELDILASDVSYLQDSDGGFRRAAVPYDGILRGKGRHAIAGDADGDGLPDVALGGLDGASDFWLNETELPSDTRPVTVRFRSHVSAWPPTGAVVTGRCGEQVWTRHLTSGGRMGASAAIEVYGAWEGCSATPEIEVSWPSGARTTHALGSGESVLTAEEPQWWTRDGTTVTLDPIAAGASKACIGGTGTDWSCCEAQSGPCEFGLTTLEDAVIAALDEAAPTVVMPKSHWGMHISPSPARPGQSAYLNIMHVGDPSTFDPTTTSVWINGDSLVLNPDFVDYERQNVQYKYLVGEGDPALYITLFPLNLLPEVTWTVPTGNSIDSDWLHQVTYSNIIFDGDTTTWHVALFANMLRELPIEEQIDFPNLKTPDGTQVSTLKQYLKNSVSRVRLLVDPMLLIGIDELRFQDDGAGYGTTILVPKPVSLEAAVSRLTRVDGNLMEPTLRGAGDLSPLILTLRDEDDRVLPPEQSLVSLEIDGAYVTESLSIYDSTYNLSALVHGDGGEGPGEVRVLGLDGAVLGEFPFERAVPPEVTLDLASTTAEFYKVGAEHSYVGSHHVSIRPMLPNGELAGAAARVELVVDGATVVAPLALNRRGVFRAGLLAEPTATEMTVQVLLDGEELNTFSAALEPTEELPSPDASGADGGVDSAPQAPTRDDGCRAAGAGSTLLWMALVMLCWCWRRRQRFA